MTSGIDLSAQAARFPQTKVVTVTPNSGPESIESYYDEYLAIPGILEAIKRSDDAIGHWFRPVSACKCCDD